MNRTTGPDPMSPEAAAATLAVNAGAPFDVIAYSFNEGTEDGPRDIGLPKVSALALIRPEDEPWIRASEDNQNELYCMLDPRAPDSEIGAFTFTGRVSGLRDLREGRLAAEFTSIGLVTPHFLRGKR